MSLLIDLQKFFQASNPSPTNLKRIFDQEFEPDDLVSPTIWAKGSIPLTLLEFACSIPHSELADCILETLYNTAKYYINEIISQNENLHHWQKKNEEANRELQKETKEGEKDVSLQLVPAKYTVQKKEAELEIKAIEEGIATAKTYIIKVQESTKNAIILLEKNLDIELAMVVINFLLRNSHEKETVSKFMDVNSFSKILKEKLLSTFDKSDEKFKELCSLVGQYLFFIAEGKAENYQQALTFLILADNPENKAIILECYRQILAPNDEKPLSTGGSLYALLTRNRENKKGGLETKEVKEPKSESSETVLKEFLKSNTIDILRAQAITSPAAAFELGQLYYFVLDLKIKIAGQNLLQEALTYLKLAADKLYSPAVFLLITIRTRLSGSLNDVEEVASREKNILYRELEYYEGLQHLYGMKAEIDTELEAYRVDIKAQEEQEFIRHALEKLAKELRRKSKQTRMKKYVDEFIRKTQSIKIVSEQRERAKTILPEMIELESAGQFEAKIECYRRVLNLEDKPYPLCTSLPSLFYRLTREAKLFHEKCLKFKNEKELNELLNLHYFSILQKQAHISIPGAKLLAEIFYLAEKLLRKEARKLEIKSNRIELKKIKLKKRQLKSERMKYLYLAGNQGEISAILEPIQMYNTLVSRPGLSSRKVAKCKKFFTQFILGYHHRILCEAAHSNVIYQGILNTVYFNVFKLGIDLQDLGLEYEFLALKGARNIKRLYPKSLCPWLNTAVIIFYNRYKGYLYEQHARAIPLRRMIADDMLAEIYLFAHELGVELFVRPLGDMPDEFATAINYSEEAAFAGNMVGSQLRLIDIAENQTEERRNCTLILFFNNYLRPFREMANKGNLIVAKGLKRYLDLVITAKLDYLFDGVGFTPEELQAWCKKLITTLENPLRLIDAAESQSGVEQNNTLIIFFNYNLKQLIEVAKKGNLRVAKALKRYFNLISTSNLAHLFEDISLEESQTWCDELIDRLEKSPGSTTAATIEDANIIRQVLGAFVAETSNVLLEAQQVNDRVELSDSKEVNAALQQELDILYLHTADCELVIPNHARSSIIIQIYESFKELKLGDLATNSKENNNAPILIKIQPNEYYIYGSNGRKWRLTKLDIRAETWALCIDHARIVETAVLKPGYVDDTAKITWLDYNSIHGPLYQSILHKRGHIFPTSESSESKLSIAEQYLLKIKDIKGLTGKLAVLYRTHGINIKKAFEILLASLSVTELTMDEMAESYWLSYEAGVGEEVSSSVLGILRETIKYSKLAAKDKVSRAVQRLEILYARASGKDPYGLPGLCESDRLIVQEATKAYASVVAVPELPFKRTKLTLGAESKIVETPVEVTTVKDRLEGADQIMAAVQQRRKEHEEQEEKARLLQFKEEEKEKAEIAKLLVAVEEKEEKIREEKIKLLRIIEEQRAERIAAVKEKDTAEKESAKIALRKKFTDYDAAARIFERILGNKECKAEHDNAVKRLKELTNKNNRIAIHALVSHFSDKDPKSASYFAMRLFCSPNMPHDLVYPKEELQLLNNVTTIEALLLANNKVLFEILLKNVPIFDESVSFSQILLGTLPAGFELSQEVIIHLFFSQNAYYFFKSNWENMRKLLFFCLRKYPSFTLNNVTSLINNEIKYFANFSMKFATINEQLKVLNSEVRREDGRVAIARKFLLEAKETKSAREKAEQKKGLNAEEEKKLDAAIAGATRQLEETETTKSVAETKRATAIKDSFYDKDHREYKIFHNNPCHFYNSFYSYIIIVKILETKPPINEELRVELKKVSKNWKQIFDKVVLDESGNPKVCYSKEQIVYAEAVFLIETIMTPDLRSQLSMQYIREFFSSLNIETLLLLDLKHLLSLITRYVEPGEVCKVHRTIDILRTLLGQDDNDLDKEGPLSASLCSELVVFGSCNRVNYEFDRNYDKVIFEKILSQPLSFVPLNRAILSNQLFWSNLDLSVVITAFKALYNSQIHSIDIDSVCLSYDTIKLFLYSCLNHSQAIEKQNEIKEIWELVFADVDHSRLFYEVVSRCCYYFWLYPLFRDKLNVRLLDPHAEENKSYISKYLLAVLLNKKPEESFSEDYFDLLLIIPIFLLRDDLKTYKMFYLDKAAIKRVEEMLDFYEQVLAVSNEPFIPRWTGDFNKKSMVITLESKLDHDISVEEMRACLNTVPCEKARGFLHMVKLDLDGWLKEALASSRRVEWWYGTLRSQYQELKKVLSALDLSVANPADIHICHIKVQKILQSVFSESEVLRFSCAKMPGLSIQQQYKNMREKWFVTPWEETRREIHASCSSRLTLV